MEKEKMKMLEQKRIEMVHAIEQIINQTLVMFNEPEARVSIQIQLPKENITGQRIPTPGILKQAQDENIEPVTKKEFDAIIQLIADLRNEVNELRNHKEETEKPGGKTEDKKVKINIQ